jgi:hypothetical protein
LREQAAAVARCRVKGCAGLGAADTPHDAYRRCKANAAALFGVT